MDLTPRREKGRLAEERFFNVVRADGIAPWFCGLEQATVQQDACGIDAIARIKRQITGEVVPVPIQIKSSDCGVRRHVLHYPHHWHFRLVFVVVNDATTNSSICRQLRAQLDHPRTHGYTYDDLFREIEGIMLPAFVAKQMEERARITV